MEQTFNYTFEVPRPMPFTILKYNWLIVMPHDGKTLYQLNDRMATTEDEDKALQFTDVNTAIEMLNWWRNPNRIGFEPWHAMATWTMPSWAATGRRVVA